MEALDSNKTAIIANAASPSLALNETFLVL